MNPGRIEKIIKYAGNLLKEVLTELFGDPEKEKEKPNDKIRDKTKD